MAKNKTPWFMNPKSKAFQRWMKNQSNIMGPAIQATRGVLSGLNAESDPLIQRLNMLAGEDINQAPGVRAFDMMLASMPSRESIEEGYESARQRFAERLGNIQFGAAGKGVSDIVSALGAGLGVESAADMAQVAGAVSGQGGQGGDVYSAAILGGAQAASGREKSQALREREERASQVGMGRADLLQQLYGQRQQFGLESAREERDLNRLRGDLAREIGTMQSQSRQASDPFKGMMGQQALINAMLGNIMTGEQIREMRRQTGGGYRYGGATGGGGDEETFPPPLDIAKLIGSSSSAWLQGAPASMFSSR